MKKEILYRISRIIFTLSFMFIATLLWSNRYVENVQALEYKESLNKSISLVELSSGINIENALPISDEQGSSYEGYKMKVVNKGTKESTYKVKVLNNIEQEEKSLSFATIRYQVIKDGEVLLKAETLSDDGILFEDTVSTENIYEIKFWISYDAGSEIFNKIFSIKIALI